MIAIAKRWGRTLVGTGTMYSTVVMTVCVIQSVLLYLVLADSFTMYFVNGTSTYEPRTENRVNWDAATGVLYLLALASTVASYCSLLASYYPSSQLASLGRTAQCSFHMEVAFATVRKDESQCRFRQLSMPVVHRPKANF
jgi:hypothetical protein